MALADCVSAVDAAALRAKLRSVGVAVERDAAASPGDDGDEVLEEDEVSDDGEAEPLPEWLEDALRTVTAPPERRNCLRQKCKEATCVGVGVWEAPAVLSRGTED